MYTLYGAQGSGVAAIEAALELAGLPYERVEAASWSPGPELERLRAVNPIAQVPTLVMEDGRVMTESAAILIELGLRHPESGLLSTEPATRAQQIRGLVYIAANCYAGIGILDYPERWYPDPDDETKKRMQVRGRDRLYELWSIFADQFPGTPFLSGDRIGALDILASIVSQWSGTRKAMAAGRRDFFELLQRIDATEPLKTVRDRHWGD